MAFDGIITRQIVAELNECLLDGKINKVFEPNKNEILLGIYSNGKNYLLNICIDSVNYRINLTNSTKPNPLNAPNFCMLLRKHLIGMRIKSISNYDLERIVTIELEGFDELNDFITKKLIIELMGKHSNVILVNSNNVIIDSLRHLDTFSNSNRDILPAHEYVLPDSSKKSFLDVASFDEFYKTISIENDESFINSVANTYTGISKLFLQYLINKLNLSTAEFTKQNLEVVYIEMKKIISSTSLSCVPYNNGNKKDFVIDLRNNTLDTSVNSFIDEFYLLKENNEDFKNYRNNILKLILQELKKCTKRLYNINQKLDECSNMNTFKLYGELLTANLYKINNNINLDKIVLENYYDNNRPFEIPLDKTISPSHNAKKYFKKYNKLKNALQIVSLQKEETAKEINYIESIIYELDNAKTISEVHSIYVEIAENVIFKDTLSVNKVNKKAYKQSKKRVSEESIALSPITLDGYTIYIGKNNKQNDYLTLKFAHKNDLWFHTKDIHGSHVILKTNENEITQELINKCASIAAFYSKAKDSSNVAVDYTYVKYVKKPTGAKPGMVIYTNYTTVNVHPNNFEINL